MSPSTVKKAWNQEAVGANGENTNHSWVKNVVQLKTLSHEGFEMEKYKKLFFSYWFPNSSPSKVTTSFGFMRLHFKWTLITTFTTMILTYNLTLASTFVSTLNQIIRKHSGRIKANQVEKSWSWCRMQLREMQRLQFFLFEQFTELD